MLVTGGAGFIGSNFVRLALAETPDRVVVVDKLTYSGHRASLRDVEKNPRFAFVEADIADRDAMRAVMATHRPRAVLNFAAETHVDRSIDGPGAFVRTNINGTYELLEAARKNWSSLPGGERDGFPLPPRLDRRGVRHAGRDGPLLRGDAVRAELAVRRVEGRRRPPRARLARDVRPPDAHHELLEQLRAVPVSRRS